MATKQLTNVEKNAIAHMVASQKTSKQIAKEIGKPIEQIEKYMTKIDDMAKRTVSKMMTQSPKKKLDEKGTDEHIVDKTLRRLQTAGLSARDSSNLMSAALKAAEKTNKVFDKEDDLYAACLKRINAGSLMIKKSAGGREGVCIMTPGASAKMDKPRQSTVSRSARGNLYNIKQGKIVGGKDGGGKPNG